MRKYLLHHKRYFCHCLLVNLYIFNIIDTKQNTYIQTYVLTLLTFIGNVWQHFHKQLAAQSRFQENKRRKKP